MFIRCPGRTAWYAFYYCSLYSHCREILSVIPSLATDLTAECISTTGYDGSIQSRTIQWHAWYDVFVELDVCAYRIELTATR